MNKESQLINESGQMLVLIFIALGVVLFTVLFIISGSQIYYQNSQYAYQSEEATAIAEAGVDKALASLNKTGGAYNGEPETSFGDGSYSITITNKDAATKLVQATGYIPSKSNPKVKRTVSLQVSNGTGISFVYGMLVGNGGFSMGNDSVINGSVYSDGNISGGNNETITGDVYVAGGTQPNANQQSDCADVNCQNYIFGKNAGGENRQNVAQSFQPSTSAVINKVSLKLQQSGSPANPTVRIMADYNGSPDKNNILASGILSANLISHTQPSFVDVNFTSTPNLTANTPYWIMITTQNLDNANYFIWSLDLAQGYTRGSPAWSANWQAKNPVWTGIQGDLGFETWMGGVSTSINMNNGSVVQGNVHANTIGGITINKDAYYQVISNSIVKGNSYPNSADPPPIGMPISDANITEWKADAANLITNVDINGCPATLGPGKIDANVTTSNSCTITVTTPIWITKNLNFGNSTVFQMDSRLGSSSGVIIVDGTTTFTNGDNLLGSGTAGSYLTLLSTYNSQTSHIPAINTGNSSITGILYAPYGIISLANNANFKEAVAWQITMGTGTVLTYDSGLISTFFSAGPSGSYSIVKGTYQVK